MKVLGNKIILSLIMTFSQSLMAETKLNDVLFQNHKNNGSITLDLSEPLDNLPNIQVNKNAISITLPDTEMKSDLRSSRISFATKYSSDTILDYAVNGSSSVIKIKFPFNMEKKENKVKLKNQGRKLVLTFPRVRVPETAKKSQAETIVKKNTKLDEKYLDDLLASEKSKIAANDEVLKNPSQSQIVLGEDKINTINSSSSKKNSEFSFMKYAGKFVAFLGGVLLLFYLVVNVFKKGVINRGKMGFLNNTNLVEVLSTTYIAPKKSLMLIKAHKQVFLVSNTDQGMSFLSEVNDTNELFKTGEKEITGTNFDQDFDGIETESIEERIVLKEDITKSTAISEKKKFSDQLKNKVKGLRPLS